MGHGRLERMHDPPLNAYGAAFADVYDDWYGDVSDVEATVERLRALAEGRAVVELGVGTGRLAIPLAAAGLTVFGVDASPEMMAVLASKQPRPSVVAVLADMARLPFGDGSVGLVFAAFNTFFNLGSGEQQSRGFAEAARVIGPGGRFVVEAFVPPLDQMPETGVSVRDESPDSVTVTSSRHDALDQTITGEHVVVTPDDVARRRWSLRYATPDQLDVMAAAAGLVVEWRASSWAREPFDEESDVHVSCYRRT